MVGTCFYQTMIFFNLHSCCKYFPWEWPRPEEMPAIIIFPAKVSKLALFQSDEKNQSQLVNTTPPEHEQDKYH